MAKKPRLMYKLMKVKAATAMRLRSKEDWEGLREDVTIAQKAKKDGGNIIVEIILDTDVSSLPL